MTDAALAPLQAAILDEPRRGEAYAELGSRLGAMGRTEAAIAAWCLAVAGQPEREDWHIALYHFLEPDLALPAIYDTMAEIDQWRSRYGQAIARLRGRLAAKPALARFVLSLANWHNHHFFVGYHGREDGALQRAWGGLVGAAIAGAFPALAAPLPVARSHTGRRKLRIGHCSNRWYYHTVSKLFSNWLRCADRDRFEIYGYSASHRCDQVSGHLQAACDHFRFWPVETSATVADWAEFAAAVRSDRLDVLVFWDVGMYPPMTLLAGARLAPVQAVTWGHPLTTGLPTMDYFLSSAAMEPPGAEAHYSEKLVCLPGLGITYDWPDVGAAERQPKSRAEFNLDPAAVVYLCCQSLYKYLPCYDWIWAEIARRVPQAQFCFLQASHPDTTARFVSRLERAFVAAGLPHSPSVVFLPALTQVDYWRLNRVCDVFLDALDWSGGNTTLDAIACGLPVVTRPGAWMRGRHSAAILQQIGVTETIATTEAEYVEVAVRLGSDDVWRQAVAGRVRAQAGRAFGDRASVVALEAWFEAVAGQG